MDRSDAFPSRGVMTIKLVTKSIVLFLLVTIVAVPVYARLTGMIDTDTLEGFGRFALSCSGPIGVLIGGLAVGSATRNRQNNGG